MGNAWPWDSLYEKHGFSMPPSFPSRTLYESVRCSADKYPNSVAIDFMDKKITYRELLSSVDKCADVLTDEGIHAGDVVSVCLPNIPQTIFAFYAINKIGAVASMIHPLSSPDEVEFFLNNASSRCLFALDLLYPRLRVNVERTKVEKVFIARINDYLDLVKSAVFTIKNFNKTKIDKNDTGTIMWQDVLRRNCPGIPYKKAVSAKDTAVILYSGGTSSGKPKGIELSSSNFEFLAYTLKAYVPTFTNTTSILTILPLFHGFGLGICVNAVLTMGAKIYLVPQFSSDGFVNTIRKKKPEHIAGVPSMFSALITHKKSSGINFGFLKGAFCGGDTVAPELKARVNEFFKKRGAAITLREGYGLTETVTACAISPPRDYPLSSFGIPLPGTLMKICEQGTQKEAAPGTEGEICISSESVMRGYLNSPEENEKSLRLHADGRIWLHTGDMGMMDQNGYFYFKQRIKRILKVSGFPVYPSAVEDVLLSFPGVKACAVVGAPDDRKGQHVKAYVVLAHADADKAQVREKLLIYCKEKLNKWSVPAEFVFRNELPLTRVGKVNIVELEKENYR